MLIGVSLIQLFNAVTILMLHYSLNVIQCYIKMLITFPIFSKLLTPSIAVAGIFNYLKGAVTQYFIRWTLCNFSFCMEEKVGLSRSLINMLRKGYN